MPRSRVALSRIVYRFQCLFVVVLLSTPQCVLVIGKLALRACSALRFARQPGPRVVVPDCCREFMAADQVPMESVVQATKEQIYEGAHVFYKSSSQGCVATVVLANPEGRKVKLARKREASLQNVYVRKPEPEPQGQSLTPSDGSMGSGQPLAPNDMEYNAESVECL